MRIKAKDLQPGDRIVSTPWRGSRDEGRTITEVNHKIQIRTDHPSAGSSLYAEDTDLVIERPTPTILVELPLAVAKHMAVMVYRDDRSDTVARACQKALNGEPFKAGDVVRRNDRLCPGKTFTLTRLKSSADRVWYATTNGSTLPDNETWMPEYRMEKVIV